VKIDSLQKKAEALGVKSKGMKKPELIRSIQAAEGNQQCFGAPRSTDCPHTDCCFLSDCKKMS
jgi:hypothetical protein